VKASERATIKQTSSERVLQIQQVLKESECEFQQVHMAKSIQWLKILNNLILSTNEGMVQISKATLAYIQVHIQHAHEMI